MYQHNIALALADARVADLQRAATHSTATVPPRRHSRHLRALAVLGLAATVALVALAPTGALARPLEDAATPANASFAPADEPQGPAAQERYYSSYGEPKPLTAPQSPPPSGETPWIAIALSIVGALAIVAVSATQLRRIRVRRRRAAHTPA
jgi:hypothetical protein